MAGRSQTRKKGHIKIPGVGLCHPKLKSRKSKTCLTNDQLSKIKESVNASDEAGRASLEARLGCRPGDEVCLLRKSGLSETEKKNIEKSAFRPKMPSDWNGDLSTWLSDDDIRIVMKQYEEAYPEFKFLEVVPIDFSAQDPYSKTEKKCIVETFCKVNFKELKAEGKTKIGAVFNLDPSYKGGSHWVALFINITKKEVNYFDSYGIKPPEQIARFMRNLTLQDKKLKLQFNSRRFQFKDSECGMYSMIFILSMLIGINFKYFCRHPISDAEAQKFRGFLYR